MMQCDGATAECQISPASPATRSCNSKVTAHVCYDSDARFSTQGSSGFARWPRRRSASAPRGSARRRRGTLGRDRSPIRRASASWPVVSTPSTTTLRSSSRARWIIALTTIRSRSPPTMSATRPRSILITSSGSDGQISEAGIAGAEIVDRNRIARRRAAAQPLGDRPPGRPANALSVISTVTRSGSIPAAAISSSSQSS